MDDRQRLFHFITASSFVMDDLRLFLDTHPNDQDALNHLKKVQKVRNEAVEEYTMVYGPINSYNVNVTNSWTWAEEPWPWEGVC